ncbi:Microtubule binding Kinesin motor domain [Trypanosoma vivax]|nr:Microtubule binding Kinesin motor domain [Trypanosoma vivax]
MSSSSLAVPTLDGRQHVITASFLRSRQGAEQRSLGASARSCGRAERTPRGGLGSQDSVRVVVRLKPLSSSNDALKFYIETSAPQSTPRTGRRRDGTQQVQVNTAQKVAKGGTHGRNDTCLEDGGVGIDGSSKRSLVAVESGEARTPSRTVSGNIADRGNVLTLVMPSVDDEMETRRTYEFGHIFGPTVTDREVSDSLVPDVVNQLKAGFNACVLCYGQTGSGKTHTMNVLTPVFVQALFDSFSGTEDIVEMSYIQIYNNSAYNLLGQGRSENGTPLQKPCGTLVCEPRCMVRSVADATAKIAEGQRKRCVSSHALNAHSSRSHVLLSFHITRCIGGIPVYTCRLTLGDLAGSERIKRTGVVGDDLEEAIAINKSLSVLHSVIRATADEADVLPVRESLLTLYLASTLSDCYLLLIATVSLDKQSAPETKSSLDFATTAKRCTVTKTKTKTRVRDLISRGVSSFEETYERFVREIETLRHRVATLQEEVNIGKQLSNLMQRDEKASGSGVVGATSESNALSREKQILAGDGIVPNENTPHACEPNDDDETNVMRRHLLALEQQCAIFQSVLRDRERELTCLEASDGVAAELRQEHEQRARKREEAQKALEEATPQLGTSDLLRKVTDNFLWMQEQFDAVSQQNQVLTKAMDGMRDEHERTMTELLDVQRQLVQAELSYEELRGRVEEKNSENMTLKEQLEELNLKLLLEYTGRVVREETMSWFKASGQRAEECERLTTAFEDQRHLCDVLQSRLTSTEQELDRGNKEHSALLQEMRKKDEAFHSIWVLLTPQQKARFMSVGYSEDVIDSSLTASLHQGHENVQLRGQVRTLKKQLEDDVQRKRSLEHRIQDLECENAFLQDRLQSVENEYNALISLDQDYRDEREQMEEQICHFYTYIQENDAKKRLLENQLRDVQNEWEKLNEERQSAQCEIVELKAKLHLMKESGRVRGSCKHKSKNPPRESKEREAQLALLQHQLATKQRTNDEVSRRLGLTERRQQHLTAKATAHRRHTDLVKLKVMRRAPELLKGTTPQHRDPAQLLRNITSPASASKNICGQLLRPDVWRYPLKTSTSLDRTARGTRESVGANKRNNSCPRSRTFSWSKSREIIGRPAFMRSSSLAGREHLRFF